MLPIVLVLVAWLLLAGELGGLRTGFTSIGTGTGPGVEASARLSYDLADLDGQVADMLLVGDQTSMSETRQTAYAAYQKDLKDANASLERIGSGIDAVSGGPALFIQIENGLADYEHDVDDALYVDSQVHGRNPAQPPGSALAMYEHADNVMYEEQNGILAYAGQLIGAEQGTIRAASQSRLDLATRLISLGSVLLALVLFVLVFVQRELRRRFKRRVNLSLLLATLLTAVFTAGLIVQVSAAHDDYVQQNFAATGPMVELWQVQADVAQMNAADGHWLLDLGTGDYTAGQTEGAAATDEGGFKAQEQTVEDLDAEIFATDGSAAPADVQQTYEAFVADDATARASAGQTTADKLGAPVAFELGQAHTDYENYIAALRGALTDRESAFSAAMVSGRTALDAWQWLPAVWAPVIALLVLSGFAARLREYR